MLKLVDEMVSLNNYEKKRRIVGEDASGQVGLKRVLGKDLWGEQIPRGVVMKKHES